MAVNSVTCLIPRMRELTLVFISQTDLRHLMRFIKCRIPCRHSIDVQA